MANLCTSEASRQSRHAGEAVIYGPDSHFGPVLRTYGDEGPTLRLGPCPHGSRLYPHYTKQP